MREPKIVSVVPRKKPAPRTPKAGSSQKTTGLWLIKGTSISAVYWLHFWMLKAKNVKTIAARIK
jgi:hypothetical protein